MKILIINWRDPFNPLEGGAERFTQKYAEHWASKGDEVFWLTNRFAGAEEKKLHKGVTYLRVGPSLDGSISRYVFCYPFYLLQSIFFAGRFIRQESIDTVIDEIHGLPFFTPLYSTARNILLVCEVAGPIWDKMFPFPINKIGKWTEKIIYQLYKKNDIWSISEHTKKNIQELIPKTPVRVIELGVDEHTEVLNGLKKVKKTEYPSAVFLARLVKMKGIETALRATAKIAKEFPDFMLFLVGPSNPTYNVHLQEIVESLGIQKNIRFVGKVSEEEKFQYLKKAHFLFHFSYKEGFGLTVLEAGLVGTPTIARGGSGLEDVVTDSGILFENENEIISIFRNTIQSDTYKNLSKKAELLAQQKTWKKILSSFRMNEKASS